MTDVRDSENGYDFINMKVEITQNLTFKRLACYCLEHLLGAFRFLLLVFVENSMHT